MAVYLISYDIPESNSADYQPLWDHLVNISAVRILYSQWVVTSTETPSLLFNRIAALMRPNDGLLINELTRASINYQHLRIPDAAVSRIMAHGR